MTFRRRPLAAALLCAALSVAVLTACAPQAEPTPTPHFTSDQQAYAAAEQTYRNYIDALNKVDLSDPATFEDVYKWETGKALAADKKNLTKYHADRSTIEGESVVTRLLPESRSEDYSSVQIEGCVDVSSVIVRDAEGRSLVSPDRVSVQSITVVVTRWPSSSTHFLVSAIRGRTGGLKC
ncbi:hypothetical protein [Microbacterium sp.]|uniref:hypothetical protein n=1 Tax=Microbacterium sp. TaxID=51671 RepID=UPI003A9300B7